LFSLFDQTAENPDAPPVIPLQSWPAGSQERVLLEAIQVALTGLQVRRHERLSQAEENGYVYRHIFDSISDGLIINDSETGVVADANPAACAMHGYEREEFIGLHPTSYIHPDSHHLSAEYLAVQPGSVVEGLSLHVRRDGSLFYVEMHGAAFTYQDRPCVVGVVRDVSQRIQAEQVLRRRVEARTLEQATLLEVSQTLTSELELKPDLILDQLRVIIEYTHAGLFALEDSTLVTLAVRGPQGLDQAVPFRVRLDGMETLAALSNGHRPTRIADVWSDDPRAQLLRSLLYDQVPSLLEGAHAWMWVPLAVKGRVIGGLGVAHTERDYFTPHHADLALIVANQASISMENAELYDHAQTLATLQERQRLARNLHDAVNQSLFSAGLIAEVLPRLWEQDQDEARRALEDLRRLTRGALAEMRMMLAELRPLALTDASLADMISLLGTAFTGRTDIPVVVTVVGERGLPSTVQVALYRVCQEGLNNIAKHARASRVTIDLKFGADAVDLRVADDGIGFNPDHIPSGHFGLSIMRERAEAVRAKMSLESQPGHGTEITIHWAETPQQEVSGR
jgi:PAS domain S-box-containing protein